MKKNPIEVFECPECHSITGPCNMKRPTLSDTGWIHIAGHCQDCGYSFTCVYELKLIEIYDRT
jgi:hypothetical protein